MSTPAVEQLRRLGFDVEMDLGPAGLSDDAVLVVRDGSSTWRFLVEEKDRAPRRVWLDRVGPARHEHAIPSLLITDYVSKPLGDELAARGISWIDAHGNIDLRAPGLRVRERNAERPSDRPERLPQGSGASALIRTLIQLESDLTSRFTLTELAGLVGITQPRASQIMRSLTDLKLATPVVRGTWRVDRAQLLDRFLSEYEGPRGAWHRYHSLDSPWSAARDLLEVLPSDADPVVSGDLAADLLRPVRRPTDLIVYVRPEAMDPLRDIPFVEDEAGVGNVWLCQAQDTSIWSSRQPTSDDPGFEVPIADLVQVAWDLHRLGGEDRDEAADAVVRWILEGR
jgi:hypothetical protein